jgi:hypothetical protein
LRGLNVRMDHAVGHDAVGHHAVGDYAVGDYAVGDYAVCDLRRCCFHAPRGWLALGRGITRLIRRGRAGASGRDALGRGVAGLIRRSRAGASGRDALGCRRFRRGRSARCARSRRALSRLFRCCYQVPVPPWDSQTRAQRNRAHTRMVRVVIPAKGISGMTMSHTRVRHTHD